MGIKRPIVKYGDQFEELRDGDSLPTETVKSIGETLSKTPQANFDPKQYSLSMSGGSVVLTPYDQILTGFSEAVDKRYISSDPNSGDGLGSIINNCTDITLNDSDYIAVSSVSKLYRLSFTGLKAYLKSYFDGIYTTLSAVQTWVASQNYLTASSLVGYATQTWVNSQGFTTSSAVASQITSALTGYATQAWITTQGYITGVKTINGNTISGSGSVLVGSSICGILSISQTSSSTLYYVMNSILSGAAFAGRAGRQIPFAAGTFKYFFVRTNTAQPASGSLVISLYVNAAVTAISITIAAGSAAGVFSDITNSVAVANGDLACYEVINNATTTSATIQTASINYYA